MTLPESMKVTMNMTKAMIHESDYEHDKGHDP
jgi:hypothetical protein